MGDGNDAIIGLRARRKFTRLGSRRAYWLVQHHIEPTIQCRYGRSVMRVVRAHDGDGVDAIGTRNLFRNHGRDIGVSARCIQPHRDRRFARAIRVRREDTAHQLPPTIELGCTTMHAADPRLRCAADEGQAQRTMQIGRFSRCLHEVPLW